MREVDMYRMFQHENIISVLVGCLIPFGGFIYCMMNDGADDDAPGYFIIEYKYRHGKGWYQDRLHFPSLLQGMHFIISLSVISFCFDS